MDQERKERNRRISREYNRQKLKDPDWKKQNYEKYKESRKETRRKWMQKNPEKANEYKKRYLETPENREKYNRYQKEYQDQYRYDLKVHYMRNELRTILNVLPDEHITEPLFVFMKRQGMTLSAIYKMFQGKTSDQMRAYVLNWFDRLEGVERKAYVRDIYKEERKLWEVMKE